ncbi:uncharacterized protein MYCFIDRAFT_72314 [Pseudocercospora fijiensis CIRAD86]|uniref:Uncharacterized protein n=1 Tax=Pseudocercospora fijiensis (strain CIRAD86) TaxID=383855 RepID=M2Z7V3_PSEFD|nr:uncharacterized protein MYCFIDRAFT_72314 [Pseudocercospora fijiensis CIRAD86]EME85840.1 hypothetical protein MYCFIDRAFT_72314 [Pseudocercospora fijiensis CIRAD86]
MEETGQRSPVSDFTADSIETAMKMGVACGSVGFLFGGAVGILRGLPVFFAATATGVQTFGLGTAFTWTRLSIIHAWTTEQRPPTSSDLIKATAIAGGFSGGAMGALFRGRKNILPGMLMWSIFGAAGQYSYNLWTVPRQIGPQGPGFWQRMSEKSWTPFRVLSNEEYATMLKEKQLRLDVEISILEDKIAAIKKEQSESGNETVASDGAEK